MKWLYLLSGALCASFAWAQQGVITTYAGRDRTFTLDGQPATSFFIGGVSTVNLDSSGNPVIALPFRHIVVRVNPNGTVTRLAGTGNPGFAADGIKAVNAPLRGPQGAAFDSAGNLYISDTLNGRILKVGLDGTVANFAGTGQIGGTGDGGPAAKATFARPNAVLVDAQNNVYIGDEGNRRVRRVTPDGIIRNYAGGGNGPFQNNQAASALSIGDAANLALDTAGNLYIADFGFHRILKVDAQTQLVTNIAGTGQPGDPVEGGVAATSPLANPGGVAVDAARNVYVADTAYDKILKIGADGTMRTIAGNGDFGFGGDGGPALAAGLGDPFGLAVDARSNLFIADRDNFRLRRVDTSQRISTVAGNGTAFDNGVPAANLFLFQPSGVTIAPDGSLIIADTFSNVVRRVRADGTAYSIAGTGAGARSGDTGLATSAAVNMPFGTAYDAQGNLYIAENGSNVIRKVDANGVITTVAGTGVPGYNGDNIAATSAALFHPAAVAFDASGAMYIADFGNNAVRRVAGNVITTVAGNGRAEFSGDNGPGAKAGLNGPIGLAFDSNGNLLIADVFNARIRKLSPSGTITTFAGGGQIAGTNADGGPATAALFTQVVGLTTDSAGNVYFTDANLIRKISPNGTLSTIAGAGNQGFSGDGGPARLALLNAPAGVAVDKAGNVFIADTQNDRVRVVTTSPSFQLDASSLTFNAASGGLPADAQTVNVAGSLPGLPFQVTVNPASPWLAVNPPSGQMPAKLSITADPGQLAQGTVEADITVTSTFTNPLSQTIHVRFNVGAPQPARLAPETSQLNFSFARQGAAASRAVRIRNSGGGTLSFDVAASSNASWLRVSSTSGSALPGQPYSLVVTADPAGLDPGTYIGSLTLANRAGGDLATIAVNTSVSSTPQTMALSQNGLTFNAVQGIQNPVVQNFEVINNGLGSMDWTLSAQVLGDGPNWLVVNNTSGTSTSGAVPPSIGVQVQTNGLSAGTYYSRITVTSPTAVNSPQMLAVVLNVLRPDQSTPPVVQPAGLIFAGVAGGPNPPAQTVTVSNLTATPLTLGSSRTFVGTGNWFVHDPINATIPPGSSQTITVTPIVAGLTAGVYQGALSLAFSDGTAQAVLLRLIVAPAGTSAAPDGHPAAAPAGCTATKLVPLFTTLTGGFSVPAAWPEAVVVRVADDCGAPVTSGDVSVAFSNGDSPVRLLSLSDGRWSQTWTPVHTTASLVLTATAQRDALSGASTVSGGLIDNPDPPLVTPEGILNAANSSPGAPLAPGSLITIYGAKLADSAAAAVSLPLETSLQGVQVVMAGRALPLQYAGTGQINAIIPYDLPVNAPQSLVILRGNKQSAVVTIPVADSLPAVFTRDGSQGVVVDPGNVFYDASHPAHPGDAAVIYCTGLGAVTGDVPAGSASPSDPLAGSRITPAVTIGGISAPVFFSGLTPGSAGLYQINLIVPAGVTPGNAVPVVVTSAGRSSAPVTMAVQ